MSSFKNKVVAITGAGSGIGKATAFEVGSRGATLSLCDINEAAVQGVVAELKAQGITAIGRKVDVMDSDSVDAWIADTVKQLGRIDAAANIAGIVALPGTPVFTSITDITNEHWAAVLGINLTGLFYCLRAQLRVMTAGGAVLNVASLAGLMGRPGIAAYSSSKHGVVGLTRSAAKEVGKRGIRVNALAPGPVDTPMLTQLKGDAKDAQPVTETYKNVPLQRTGTAQDMARTIAFALSDDAAYTTGATFSVDGGIAC